MSGEMLNYIPWAQWYAHLPAKRGIIYDLFFPRAQGWKLTLYR